MSLLKVSLLGSPLVERDGKPVHLERRKSLALLAYLSVEGKPVMREFLASLLWPDLNRTKALRSLRRTLASLRKDIGEECIISDHSIAGLNPGDRLWIDVLEFERKKREIEKFKSEDNLHHLHQEAEILGQIADLYRGDFIAGLELGEVESFDEWAALQRQRYLLVVNEASSRLVELHFRLNEPEEAVKRAQQLLAVDPFNESIHRSLMKGLALAGRRPEALKQYEYFARMLERELQVAPEPETVLLHRQLREGWSMESLSTSGLQAESVRQIKENLPATTTAFIGREAELSLVKNKFRDDTCRLILLAGPGGIGKTRLAIEAARSELDNFEDGVYFVPLSSIYQPNAVLPAIAEVLEFQSPAPGELLLQMTSILKEKRVLFILDNFEQVVEADLLISELISRTRNIKILVTSRQRLRLRSQFVLELEGLQFPSQSEYSSLGQYGAVQLFVDSARRVVPDFELNQSNEKHIASICRQVFGMPLGLELAASWIRVLSCQEIADQMKNNLDFLSSAFQDLPSRHRTLRAVFDSSLDLLPPDEEQIFLQLSVFEGGFSLDSANAVVAASFTKIMALLDKSLLIRQGNGRFQAHELLRQFALSKLEESVSDNLRIRNEHAKYMFTLLQNHSAVFRTGQQNEAIHALRLENENLKAAWKWAAESGNTGWVQSGMEAFYRYFLLSSRYEEGLALFEYGMKVLGEKLDQEAKACLRGRQGGFRVHLGQYHQARKDLEWSLEVLRKSELLSEVAFLLTQISSIAYVEGEYGQARLALEESLQLYQELDMPEGKADCFQKMGRLAGTVGEYESARLSLQSGLGLFRNLKDRFGEARTLINLGGAALLSKQPLEARRLYQEAFEICENLDDKKGMAMVLANLSLIFEETRSLTRSRELGRESLKLFREIGDLDSECRVLENLARISFELGDDNQTLLCLREGLRLSLSIFAVPAALMLILGFCRLYIRNERKARSYEVLTYVLHHPKVNDEAREHALKLIGKIKSDLSEEEKLAAQRKASRTDLEELVNQLLSDPL